MTRSEGVTDQNIEVQCLRSVISDLLSDIRLPYLHLKMDYTAFI